MSLPAILRLENLDDSKIIDLLHPSGLISVRADWHPALQQYKGGAVYQDSPVANRRRRVFSRFTNVTESIPLALSHPMSQNEIIYELRDLFEILLDAVRSRETKWSEEIVHLHLRTTETDTLDQFGLIEGWSIPELGRNPFAAPFINNAGLKHLTEVTLNLEHRGWQEYKLGTNACTNVGSQQNVIYLGASLVSSAPTQDVQVLAANATLMVALSNVEGFYTADGTTWFAAGTPPSMNVYDAVAFNDGYIYAFGNDGATGAIWRSNDGNTWASVSATIQANTGATIGRNDIIFANDGYLYVAANNGIHRSNNGTAWTQVFSATGMGGLFQTSAGVWYAWGITTNIVWRSTNGTTWTVVYNSAINPTGYTCAYEDLEGNVIIIPHNGTGDTNWLITSDGIVWSFLDSSIRKAGVRGTVIIYAKGYYWAAFGDVGFGSGAINGSLYRSVNGYGWERISQYSSNIIALMSVVYFAATDLIYFGTRFTDRIYELPDPQTTTVGNVASCVDEHLITNKQNNTALSAVFFEDNSAGPTYTSVYPNAALPVTVLPAVPAVNDAIYFLCGEIPGEGPFSSVSVYIGTPASAASSWTFTYEYWNGAWTTLTVQDGTYGFMASGQRVIGWNQPFDWLTTTVNAQTGYFVRARLSALVGTLVPPTFSANPYILNRAYVDIESAAGGDSPALAMITVHNQTGPQSKGTEPDLYESACLLSTRRLSRGTDFQPFLYAGPEGTGLGFSPHNPIGVKCINGAGTALVSSLSPSGTTIRLLRNSDLARSDLCTWTLDKTISPQFYGAFHIYILASQVQVIGPPPNPGDFQLWVRTEVGTGNVVSTTPARGLDVNNEFQLLDMGPVLIGSNETTRTTELPDRIRFVIEVSLDYSGVGGDHLLNIWYLCLWPADEWFGNLQDYILSSLSPALRDDVIIADSTYYGSQFRAFVRADGDATKKADYGFVSNHAQANLDAKHQQRLWVLPAQVVTDHIEAPPYLNASVQVFKNRSFDGLRGSQS